jgi:hypothetical protein
MMIFVAAALVIGVVVFTLSIRPQDLPEPEPVSPVKHLEERKAVIYENLRDLQFEYRVGKLSDQDYQQTKQDLQRELAKVLAEIDKVQPPAVPRAAAPKAAPAPGRDRQGTVCPHCGAHFATAMKFCGECGKPIPVEAAK